MRLVLIGVAMVLGGCAVKAPVMHTMGTSWGSDCLVQSDGGSADSLMRSMPTQRFEHRMDEMQGQVDQNQMDRLDALRDMLEKKELEDRGPLGFGPIIDPRKGLAL